MFVAVDGRRRFLRKRLLKDRKKCHCRLGGAESSVRGCECSVGEVGEHSGLVGGDASRTGELEGVAGVSVV